MHTLLASCSMRLLKPLDNIPYNSVPSIILTLLDGRLGSHGTKLGRWLIRGIHVSQFGIACFARQKPCIFSLKVSQFRLGEERKLDGWSLICKR